MVPFLACESYHISHIGVVLEITETVLISDGTQCLSFKINFQAMTFVISPKISEFSSRAQKWKSENSKEARLDWNLRITSAFNSLLVFPISMYALFSELEWYDMFSSCPAAKLRSGFELNEQVTGPGLLGRRRPSADRPSVHLSMWTPDQNLG